MTLEIKDIIYILVYIISLITLLLALKNEISNIKREVQRGMKILYQDAGKLNLIDCETCKGHRDEIFMAIRRSEKALEMFLVEIREIKEGIIKLNVLVEMLKPDVIKKD